MRFLLIFLLMSAFVIPAHAEKVKTKLIVTEAEERTPIEKFCENKKVKEQKTRNNSNFKKPVEAVSFGAGKHQLDDTGTNVEVFESGAFLLELGSKYFAVQGTSYDDYMAGGKKLGGCSAEQLSEAIYNNKIVIKKEGEEAAVVQEEATETTEPVAPKNPKPRYSLPQ